MRPVRGAVCQKKKKKMHLHVSSYSASVVLTGCVNEYMTVNLLSCLFVPWMSINVMLQWRWVTWRIRRRWLARHRGKGSALGSRAVWKRHDTFVFTQSPCSAILHSAAPLHSFIVPSLFFHLLFHYFLVFPSPSPSSVFPCVFPSPSLTP